MVNHTLFGLECCRDYKCKRSNSFYWFSSKTRASVLSPAPHTVLLSCRIDWELPLQNSAIHNSAEHDQEPARHELQQTGPDLHLNKPSPRELIGT